MASSHHVCSTLRPTMAIDRAPAWGSRGALLGLVTALGADAPHAPEISSAVACLHADVRAVGLGVVLGSNIFDLAALLRLSAALAGARCVVLVRGGGVALWRRR